MSSLVSAELDPLFIKAIQLLRSKHPDSAKQLNTLVTEYREKTYGVSTKKKNETGSTPVDNQDSSTKTVDVSKIKKREKKSSSPVTLMGKLEEITNITDEKSGERVTIKEEEVEEITVGSSLEPSSKKQRLHSKVSSSGTSPLSDHDNIPIDDIIEMDFDGPMCKICHLNKRSEDENLLAECSECHSHFHQLCHKPNVSTKDLNDPRLIWYCARCTKKMSKEMAAQQQQQQQTSTSSSIKPTEPPAKVVANPFQQAKPFRRTIPTTETASKTGDGKSGESKSMTVSAPIASMDTVMASKVKESSPASREGSPSSKPKPRDVQASSMKRLEQVKKKANKMQQLMKQQSRK